MYVPSNAIRIAKNFDGKSFKSVAVPLYLLFRANFEQGRGVIIHDCVFEDCNIEGPALMMPMGEMQFDRCDFGRAEGDMGNLLLRPLGQKVTGAIAMFRCSFIECRFVSVGFTGDEQFLLEMRGIKTSH